MKYFVLLSILLSSQMTVAQIDRKGNGGDVVVCKNSIQVLDVYEARALRGLNLDLGPRDLTIEQKLDLAIKRLHKVDPYRASMTKIIADSFFKETSFIRGGELRDVEDSNEIYLPRGCVRQQIAIQNVRVVATDPFYVINADLWDQLDNENKVALILHEVLYRASRNAWTSPTVRFFNSMLFTNFLDHKTKREFYEYVHGTPLKVTLNAGQKAEGRWFFQMPQISPAFDQFWLAEEWDIKTAKKSLDYMCQMKFGASPVAQKDLPEIYKIIKEHYDWGNLTSSSPERLVVAMDGALPAIYSLSYSGDISKKTYSKNLKGEVWCSSKQAPPFMIEGRNK